MILEIVVAFKIEPLISSGSPNYSSSKHDCGIQGKYRLTHEQISIDIDVKYACGLSEYEEDFDINYFVLSRINHECDITTPIGKIRHLHYNRDNYPSYFSDRHGSLEHCHAMDIRMKTEFMETYKRCQEGKFSYGRGFKNVTRWYNEWQTDENTENYNKYHMRLKKMLDYGYILVE